MVINLKRVTSIMLILMSLMFMGMTAYGAPSSEISNSGDVSEESSSDESSSSGKLKMQDGKERSADDIFCDSGAPSSFKGAHYYDTAIPYEMTHEEIGGCSIAGTAPKPGWGGLFVMSDEVRKRHVGCTVQLMGSDNYTINRTGCTFDNSKVEYGFEEETGARIMTDSHGVQYYMMAIQGIHFKSSSAYFPDSAAFLGMAVDVYLTDGTVIHTSAVELNSDNHTNGTVDGSPTTTVDGYLVIDELKKEQYRNLFQACNGGMIELIGHGSEKFMQKYNIGDGEGQNRIMYYRMYDFKCDNAPEPASDDVKGLSYKLGVDGALGSGSENSDEDVVVLEQTGIWDETQFVKWKVMINADELEFGSQSDMHEKEVYDIENWLSDIEKQKGDNFLVKGGRWIAILFGILFEVWMMFIYLAYWFDRINNFIEVSLLSIITFGKLRISPDENECTFSVKSLASSEMRTINHKKLLGVVIVGLAFGALIISGIIFVWLYAFVNKILSWIG